MHTLTRTIAAVAAGLAVILTGCTVEDGNTIDSTTTDAERVTFEVTGKTPSGRVDITYGDDSSNLSGKRLPFEESMRFDGDALYYVVTAQLGSGGGKIRCSVTIGDKTKTGRARGEFNICSAQINVF